MQPIYIPMPATVYVRPGPPTTPMDFLMLKRAEAKRSRRRGRNLYNPIIMVPIRVLKEAAPARITVTPENVDKLVDAGVVSFECMKAMLGEQSLRIAYMLAKKVEMNDLDRRWMSATQKYRRGVKIPKPYSLQPSLGESFEIIPGTLH